MQNKNVSVGLFVVGGLLLFGAGLFLIGDRRQAFGEHAEYYAEFTNLAGLSSGAEVRVGGMAAGEVVGIGVPDSPSSRFRVKWRIRGALRGLVRTDSVVTIDTEGVVGGTYLAVRPGTVQGAQAAALATIPSQDPAELSELLTRGSSLLNDAQAMLKDVGGKLSGTLDGVSAAVSNVNDIAVGLKQGRGAAGMLLTDDALAKQVRQSITSTTTNIDELVAGIKAGRGAVGILLRNDAVSGQVQESINNVQLATANLADVTRQAGAMVSQLNAQKLPEKAGAVIDNLNASTQQVHQMLTEINQPDRQGLSAAANIRESLTNANVATVNLADGTEALKHNFLLRGFFRSRGYFTLDHISPDQYRRDPAFTSRTNRRMWLSASDLFQDGANAQEELSPRGRELLDATLAESGDGVVESPLVVEGYWRKGSVSDQLWRSRNRAILVRQYLLAQLQLEPSNVGVVPMRGSAPQGTEHPTWDGVCIVVVRKKSK
jgi:phospholipid/cholesterol/gamma-HCH transport system substrate-binding protein